MHFGDISCTIFAVAVQSRDGGSADARQVSCIIIQYLTAILDLYETQHILDCETQTFET